MCACDDASNEDVCACFDMNIVERASIFVLYLLHVFDQDVCVLG